MVLTTDIEYIYIFNIYIVLEIVNYHLDKAVACLHISVSMCKVNLPCFTHKTLKVNVGAFCASAIAEHSSAASLCRDAATDMLTFIKQGCGNTGQDQGCFPHSPLSVSTLNLEWCTPLCL